MRILLFLFSSAIIFVSCHNEKNIPAPEFVNVDVSVEFVLVNDQGENLLDPNKTDGIKESDIIVYYLINGVKTEIYDPNLNAPRKFLILDDTDTGDYYLILVPNTQTTTETPTTYIEWNSVDTDTIQCKFLNDAGNFYTEKVWYNGVELTDPVPDKVRRFIIKK